MPDQDFEIKKLQARISNLEYTLGALVLHAAHMVPPDVDWQAVSEQLGQAAKTLGGMQPREAGTFISLKDLTDA